MVPWREEGCTRIRRLRPSQHRWVRLPERPQQARSYPV